MSKSRANDIDKLVSKKLRMRRILLGLSQQDLATAVNVTVQQIQKYEKAKNRISSGKLYALANFLKVPVSYFFTKLDANTNEITKQLAKIPDEKKVNEVSDKITEAEVIKLIKAYTQLMILKFVKNLWN
ncbi:MAG: helix-turn-helix transcriptional regulator [Rickettsiaceae bacterium]|nr:helix-turn-helix transcriptional regulator [Rickettsiaceae bacterium]